MTKEMLINVLQPEETRIAILEDGVLDELSVDRVSNESYVGNIYKGRVVNIEPSIQAAFVDFGVGRNGFLHISDIDPQYYGEKGGDDRPERGGRGSNQQQRRPRRGEQPISETRDPFDVREEREGRGDRRPERGERREPEERGDRGERSERPRQGQGRGRPNPPVERPSIEREEPSLEDDFGADVEPERVEPSDRPEESGDRDRGGEGRSGGRGRGGRGRGRGGRGRGRDNDRDRDRGRGRSRPPVETDIPEELITHSNDLPELEDFNIDADPALRGASESEPRTRREPHREPPPAPRPAPIIRDDDDDRWGEGILDDLPPVPEQKLPETRAPAPPVRESREPAPLVPTQDEEDGFGAGILDESPNKPDGGDDKADGPSIQPPPAYYRRTDRGDDEGDFGSGIFDDLDSSAPAPRPESEPSGRRNEPRRDDRREGGRRRPGRSERQVEKPDEDAFDRMDNDREPVGARTDDSWWSPSEPPVDNDESAVKPAGEAAFEDGGDDRAGDNRRRRRRGGRGRRRRGDREHEPKPVAQEPAHDEPFPEPEAEEPTFERPIVDEPHDFEDDRPEEDFGGSLGFDDDEDLGPIDPPKVAPDQGRGRGGDRNRRDQGGRGGRREESRDRGPRDRDQRGGDRRGGRQGGGQRSAHRGDPRRPRQRPPIQEILRRGQEIIVQVIKEGIGNKGPTLSTYISIPGRYLVLMPGLSRVGVSRKIVDEQQRRQLKEIVTQLERPDGVGFIIRTAGLERTQKELERDLAYLLRLWEVVSRRIQSQKGPGLIFQESDMIIRTIRDIFTSEIDAIIIDEERAYEHAKEFLEIVMPKYVGRLRLYTDAEPLFHHFGIEAEIAKIQKKTVPLPQGGSIVIEQTEALVAIDVNSGNFRCDDNAEETAYQINLAAAKEIARQLRLRDLGGVIVNDFVDMKEERHRRSVENALRDAVQRDRARTKILRMSAFGLIEMTRQRIRPSLKRSFYRNCAICSGTGQVKTVESMSIEVVRVLWHVAQHKGVRRVHLGLYPEVASFVLNNKRKELSGIEDRFKVDLSVIPRMGNSPEDYDLTCFDDDGSIVEIPEYARG